MREKGREGGREGGRKRERDNDSSEIKHTLAAAEIPELQRNGLSSLTHPLTCRVWKWVSNLAFSSALGGLVTVPYCRNSSRRS